jgi:hypothetical protein
MSGPHSADPSAACVAFFRRASSIEAVTDCSQHAAGLFTQVLEPHWSRVDLAQVFFDIPERCLDALDILLRGGYPADQQHEQFAALVFGHQRYVDPDHKAAPSAQVRANSREPGQSHKVRSISRFWLSARVWV